MSDAGSLSPLDMTLKSIPWLLAGTAFIAFAAYEPGQALLLATYGENTDGVVTAHNEFECGRARRRRTCDDYEVQVNGETIRLDIQGQVEIGAHVPLVYLPSNLAGARPGRLSSGTWAFVKR